MGQGILHRSRHLHRKCHLLPHLCVGGGAALEQPGDGRGALGQGAAAGPLIRQPDQGKGGSQEREGDEQPRV